MLENVTVTGIYTTRFGCANVDGVAFVSGGGGTLINCKVCGVFKNGQALVDDTTDGRLTIKDSTIGTMYVNAPTSVVNYQDYTAVLLDANDTTTHIGTIICRDATSFRVSDAVVNVAAETRFVIATLTVGENTEHYTSLQAAVTAAEEAEGAEIKLLADASGAGVVFAANKHTDLTIDFNGYTYTVEGTKGNGLVGSTGTETQGFQILENNTVTLKNGTLTINTKDLVVDGKNVDYYPFVIQNYASLTLDSLDVIGDARTSYVVSNNSGESQIIGSTSIISINGKLAFDADKTAVVTVDTTGTITGHVKVTKTGKLTIKNGTFKQGTSESLLTCEDTASLAISGGTFTTQIEQAWCAEGFSPVSIGNGLYGVTDTPVVQKGEAAIGDTVYATLNDALTAAKASDTTCNIQLRGNVATAPAAIDFAVNIVNIGGYTIAGNLASDVLTAASGYILTDVGEMGMIFKISQDNNVYVAKIDGKQYTTVEAALAAAKSGDTVVMFKDSEETGSVPYVSAGVTLDLNGHTLTAAGLIAFNGAKVKDSGETKGCISVPKEQLSLKATSVDNKIPVYNSNKGYELVSVNYNQTLTNVTDSAFTLAFRPDFDGYYDSTSKSYSADACEVLKDAGLTIEVRVSWQGTNQVIGQTYVYTENYFTQVYNSTQLKAFSLGMTGLGSKDHVDIHVAVVSDTGAELVGTNIPYNTPSA